MFPQKQDNHFQAVIGKEKGKEGQKGPSGAVGPAPETKAPSTAVNPVQLQLPSFCGVKGHLQQLLTPIPVLGSGGDAGADAGGHGGHGVWLLCWKI